jgi:predicted transposase
MYTTLKFRLITEKKENLEALKNFMRLQSSAVRFAYNRLKENYSNKDVYHLIRNTFQKLPSRYTRMQLLKHQL